MISDSIKSLLDEKVELYNNPSFIPDDPISIPHRFTLKQDIEIIGFWTAILSWGQRKTILKKANQLCEMMDNSPYDFIMHHSDKELRRIEHFKHRTFNGLDALYFVDFFHWYYSQYDSLEDIFIASDASTIYDGIVALRYLFTNRENFLSRTGKHVASPAKNSSCKRINMFLRWMVRNDDRGVDFGIWKRLSASQLMIPLDVHVYRVASRLKILHRDKTDWKAVEELTANLRKLDPLDPVKYDFALFGMGVLDDDDLYKMSY